MYMYVNVRLSRFMISNMKLDYFIFVEGEFRVPKKLYVGKDLFQCTIVASNRHQTVTREVVRPPLIPITTTQAPATATVDSTKYLPWSTFWIVAGITIGIIIMMLSVVIGVIFCRQKCRKQSSKADKALTGYDNHQRPPQVVVDINTMGMNGAPPVHDDITYITPDNAPPSSLPSLEYQSSVTSSGVSSHHSSLEEDGSREQPPSFPRQVSYNPVEENPDNIISKRHEICDQLHDTDSVPMIEHNTNLNTGVGPVINNAYTPSAQNNSGYIQSSQGMKPIQAAEDDSNTAVDEGLVMSAVRTPEDSDKAGVLSEHVDDRRGSDDDDSSQGDFSAD